MSSISLENHIFKGLKSIKLSSIVLYNEVIHVIDRYSKEKKITVGTLRSDEQISQTLSSSDCLCDKNSLIIEETSK